MGIRFFVHAMRRILAFAFVIMVPALAQTVGIVISARTATSVTAGLESGYAEAS